MTAVSPGSDDAAHQGEARPPLPLDEYLRHLDALVAAQDWIALDRLGPAVADGTAAPDVVRRAALEAYYVAKWTAPDLAMLVANAPDVYSFTMEHSTHYRHWAERLARETGYFGDAGGLRAAAERCRQLGLTDDDVRAYTPLPETIAMTFTLLFHVRRSYEEGLAVLGYLAERLGPGPRDGDASRLFRQVAVTRPVQDRCRDAIRKVLSTAECRVRAMNRWVE